MQSKSLNLGTSHPAADAAAFSEHGKDIMKRPFFQATVLAAASGFVLLLFAQPVWANDSIILRCASSFDRCAHATALPLYGGWIDGKPDPAGAGNGATRLAAKLGTRYVFEGGPDFSGQRYSPFVRVGGIAGVLNAPTFAPDGERPYGQNAYSPLLNMQVRLVDNARRIRDFAMSAARGANPAGFLVNHPDVVQVIQL